MKNFIIVIPISILVASCTTTTTTTTTNSDTGGTTVSETTTSPSSELGLLISAACQLFLDQSAILKIIGANLGESNQEQADAVCSIFRNQQATTIQTASRSTAVTIQLPNGTSVTGTYNPELAIQ